MPCLCLQYIKGSPSNSGHTKPLQRSKRPSITCPIPLKILVLSLNYSDLHIQASLPGLLAIFSCWNASMFSFRSLIKCLLLRDNPLTILFKMKPSQLHTRIIFSSSRHYNLPTIYCPLTYYVIHSYILFPPTG